MRVTPQNNSGLEQVKDNSAQWIKTKPLHILIDCLHRNKGYFQPVSVVRAHFLLETSRNVSDVKASYSNLKEVVPVFLFVFLASPRMSTVLQTFTNLKESLIPG